MVSIIILTHNRAFFLEQNLASLVNQSYKNFEIIIVDDGSEDNTHEVIQKFDFPRIKYFYMTHTGNVSSLRNKGIRESSGDIIAFCDDDDIWLPGKMEFQLKLMDRYDFVCSNFNVINERNDVVDPKFFKDMLQDVILTPEKLLFRNSILTSSVLMKKNIIERVGMFDEVSINCNGEDYEYFMRTSFVTDIYYSDELLVSYRRHGHQSYSIDNRPKMISNSIKIVLKYLHNKDNSVRFAALKGIFHYRGIFFEWYLKNLHILKAVKEFFKILFLFKNLKFLFFVIRKAIGKT